MSARLFCKTGQLAGSEYRIDREATIGTASGNTIQLAPPVISGRHARIFLDEKSGRYMLEDFGSSNGTKLDGIAVRGIVALEMLHVITLANEHDLIFRVLSSAPAVKGAPAPPPRRAASEPVRGASAAHSPSSDRERTVFDDGAMVAAPAPMAPDTAPDRGKTVFDDGAMEASPAPKAPDAAAGRGKTVFDDGAMLPPMHGKAPAAADRSEHPPTALAMNFEDPGKGAPAASKRPAAGVDDGGAASAPRAAEKTEQLVLIVFTAGGSLEFALSEGEAVLGREEGVDIRIDDTSVSRRHAIVMVRGGSVSVRDLGSKNHTFVGADIVTQERAVAAGASLAFGLIKAQLIAR